MLRDLYHPTRAENHKIIPLGGQYDKGLFLGDQVVLEIVHTIGILASVILG